MAADLEKVPTHPQWLSRGLWMEGLAALVVIVGLYGWIPYNFGFESKARPVLEMLYRFWTDPSTTDWHHGMIVPLISLGLVIHRWKDLQKVPIQPSLWGIPVVMLALLLFCAKLFRLPRTTRLTSPSWVFFPCRPCWVGSFCGFWVGR